MESLSTQCLSFKVARKNPELIAPAKPTPHEFKVLSDIDDQEGLRFHIPAIHFFRGNPSAEGKDPVKVIRDAIGKALVLYYPFAGRLRECSGGKLAVECTGEGVLFIEADADVTLQQFGEPIYPPFPCTEELLYDVPASSGVLHSPLLLIQVTRLKCGGFIFGVRFNHSMCDGDGLAQFMSAIGEVALGAETPSILPTWDRHLLCARDDHMIISPDSNKGTTLTPVPEYDDGMVYRSFFFGGAELSALRRRLPLHLRGCSAFDLLTACLWRCRTIVISTDPNEEVQILFTWNFRKQMNPPLPDGYYGNAMVLGVASASADELSGNPLHYAVELVKRAKIEVMEELKKSSSSVQPLILRGQQHFMGAGSYTVSDMTRNEFEEVDFGWGKSMCGGPVEDNFFGSFYIPYKNSKGQTGRMAPICLPPKPMDVFVNDLHRMLTSGDDHHQTNLFIKSPL